MLLPLISTALSSYNYRVPSRARPIEVTGINVRSLWVQATNVEGNELAACPLVFARVGTGSEFLNSATKSTGEAGIRDKVLSIRHEAIVHTLPGTCMARSNIGLLSSRYSLSAARLLISQAQGVLDVMATSSQHDGCYISAP